MSILDRIRAALQRNPAADEIERLDRRAFLAGMAVTSAGLLVPAVKVFAPVEKVTIRTAGVYSITLPGTPVGFYGTPPWKGRHADLATILREMYPQPVLEEALHGASPLRELLPKGLSFAS